MTDDEKGDARRPDNLRWLRPNDPATTTDTPEEDASPAAPGRIRGVRTFLELVGDPQRTPRAPRIDRLSITRAHKPTVAFYRFLYHTVGEPWLWYERRAMPDAELHDVINDPAVQIYVLYSAGVPAGFVELRKKNESEVKIGYFGLMPDFIGQRLGPYFLDWAIAKGFSLGADRMSLDTCTLDHPKAIVVYQRAGFVPYGQEHFEIDDPRLDASLGFSASAGRSVAD